METWRQLASERPERPTMRGSNGATSPTASPLPRMSQRDVSIFMFDRRMITGEEDAPDAEDGPLELLGPVKGTCPRPPPRPRAGAL